MPELIRAKYITEIRYSGAASFHSEKGNIVSEFQRPPFEHWKIDQFRINVHSEDNKYFAFATSKNAGLMIVLPETRAEFENHAQEFISNVCRKLHLSSLLRVGFRAMTVIPFDEFHNVVEFHRHRIHGQIEENLRTLGEVHDYSSIWQVGIDDYRGNMRIGPMERSQLKQILETELEDDLFPVAMLFTDFDFFIENPNVGRRVDRYVGEFIREGISQTISRTVNFYTSFGIEIAE
jgi:hypothetical protein